MHLHKSIQQIAYVSVFAVALLPSTVWAWGQGHRIIRTWAVSKLPGWQRELLAEEHWTNLQTRYTSLQDTYAGNKSAELVKYCEPPAKLSLHDVGSIDASLIDLQWYLENILDELDAGQPDEAMKFLGVLCHWNEDPGSPSAHSSPIDELTLKRLIPPTKEFANKNYLFGYGGIADSGTYTIPDIDYQPRLLGTSIPEAAARIYQHQRLLRQHAAAHIVPMVQAVVAGDAKRADEFCASAAAYNARHTADIIYTVFCLAEKRFEPAAVERLATQRLTEWEADARMQMIAHPYYVSPYLIDQAMDASRNLHPLAFSGAGDSSSVEFGVGMGAPYTLSYKVGPGAVFDRFTCRAGLHPTAGENGKVAFAVLVNGREVHRTDFVSPGDAPCNIEIALPETPVIALGLQTIAHPDSTPNHNLAVWGEPTLHRADGIPLRPLKAPKEPVE